MAASASRLPPELPFDDLRLQPVGRRLVDRIGQRLREAAQRLGQLVAPPHARQQTRVLGDGAHVRRIQRQRARRRGQRVVDPAQAKRVDARRLDARARWRRPGSVRTPPASTGPPPAPPAGGCGSAPAPAPPAPAANWDPAPAPPRRHAPPRRRRRRALRKCPPRGSTRRTASRRTAPGSRCPASARPPPRPARRPPSRRRAAARASAARRRSPSSAHSL